CRTACPQSFSVGGRTHLKCRQLAESIITLINYIFALVHYLSHNNHCCKMLQRCEPRPACMEICTIAIPLEARKGNGRYASSRRPSGPCRRRMLRGADGA